MVNSLIFKWEDSEALKHHCGFCERPLSHPGARASCFGKHSEPCVRFHQAMFMRLRGHTCKYCMGIDEQHYKRHHDIAERLRAVYESCGEVDWTIIPDDPDLDERGRARDPGDEDAPSSKRERKDAKRLARAASRSRVITQEEIRYIDSVVHSAEGITSNDTDGPRNPEEIEEIERQLRYHAHVYSTQVSRKGLRKLAEAPDDSLGVDFEAEMDRVLETFRLNELLRRNTKTKGLQGKELRTFENLVDGFKQAVLEDIVLVKKDNAEARMRRAGYLRYTSKTAYGIVEERYTGKDWKTGEKVTSSSSDSSAAMTPADEIGPPSNEHYDDPSPRRSESTHSPDRRHLESNHKRVNGDDGLYHADIEPYHAPLLSLPPTPTPISNKQAAAVMVINVKASERRPAMVRGGNKKPELAPDGWQVVTNGVTPTQPVARTRVWGNIPSKPPARAPRPLTPWLSDSRDFPDLTAMRSSSGEVRTQAPAVGPPKTWGMQEPESFVADTEDPANGHPAVSQKKKAKKAREAKRKANKQSISEEATDISGPRDEGTKDVDEVIYALPQGASTPSPDCKDLNDHKVLLLNTTSSGGTDMIAKVVVEPVPTNPGPAEKVSSFPTVQPIPVTKHGKHMHWIRFARKFIGDQLTNPFPPSWNGCSHGTSCSFENNDIPDCPFHEPHCPCVDPLGDQCYLAMPCQELCSMGPFNRLRGEKLLSLYEKDHRTKGRLMLVDDDLVNYFMEDPARRARNHNPDGVPARLQKEYDEVKNGYNPGPLMAQELRFERLYAKNGFVKQELTQAMLQDIQRNEFERPGTKYMCYCRAAVPKRGPSAKETVICSHRDCVTRYFHKSCVKKLGVEKVSHWYCTPCEQQMKILARQTLRGLGYTDIPDEYPCSYPYELDVDKFEEMFDEKFKQMIGSPNMDYLTALPPDVRDAIKELGGLSSMPEIVQKQIKEKIRALGTNFRGAEVRTFDF